MTLTCEQKHHAEEAPEEKTKVREAAAASRVSWQSIAQLPPNSEVTVVLDVVCAPPACEDGAQKDEAEEQPAVVVLLRVPASDPAESDRMTAGEVQNKVEATKEDPGFKVPPSITKTARPTPIDQAVDMCLLGKYRY
jgi:hypothetical protein